MKHISIVCRSPAIPDDGEMLVLQIQKPSHLYWSLGMYEEDNERIVKHPGGIPLDKNEVLLHWAQLTVKHV